MNDDSLTNRGTCAVRDCARSLTTRNANLPSPETAASATFAAFGELEQATPVIRQFFAALAAAASCSTQSKSSALLP